LTEEQTLWFAYRYAVKIEINELLPSRFTAKIVRRLDGFPVFKTDISALPVQVERRIALEMAWRLANDAALEQVKEWRAELGSWSAVARMLGGGVESLGELAEKQLVLEGKFHRHLLDPDDSNGPKSWINTPHHRTATLRRITFGTQAFAVATTLESLDNSSSVHTPHDFDLLIVTRRLRASRRRSASPSPTPSTSKNISSGV